MSWVKIKAKNEERAVHAAAMKALLDKAEGEKRDLSADETKSFDELRVKAEGLQVEIDRLRQLAGIDDAVRAAANGRPVSDGITAGGAHEETREYDGFAAKDLAKYSLIRAINRLANRQPLDGIEGEVSTELAKRCGRDPHGFFFPTEVPTGAEVRRVERRTQLDTSTGAGAIATILDASNFIELLRNRVVVQAMGAKVLSGLVGNLAIPRQSGGGTAYWVADESAPTTSNQTIDQVTFAPNTLGAFTDMSRKFLLQTSVSAEAFVRNDLAQILAIEIDRAAVNGSGSSNQPTGILQQSGVGVVSVGANGGVPTWANMVAMEGQLGTANADVGQMGYVSNAKVRSLLKTTLKSSVAGATYIWEPTDNPLVGVINGYPARVTNNMPATLTKGTGSALSAAIFGNWNDLVLAFWSQLDIMVDPYSNSTTGTVRVVALQDLDIQVRHAASFSTMVDITA